jgi:Rieske 2Fe-2S family protein
MNTQTDRELATLQKSLPSSYYISDDIYRREKEQIFCREWLCAGREEDLPAPGSFVVLDVLGESVLVVRSKSGQLKAHYNVCRHRGARLCLSPQEAQKETVKLGWGISSAGTIRCPYHSWTYGLDGELLSAPFLRDREGFCRESLSLHPVGLETWGGFFFLNLSPADASAHDRTLLRQLGPVPERLTRYPLSELRTARRIDYEVGANWKAIAENYNECYHCGPVHPELCELVPDFKRHGGARLDWENGIPHRRGAFTFTCTGTSGRAAFATLSQEERERHKGEIIYPNFLLSLSAEHVVAFLLWPQGADRTVVSCSFMFHAGEIAKPDFDPSDAVNFWDLINRQDWAICRRVQQGMCARVHQFGYYAPMEDLSLDIRRYITERLGAL